MDFERPRLRPLVAKNRIRAGMANRVLSHALRAAAAVGLRGERVDYCASSSPLEAKLV